MKASLFLTIVVVAAIALVLYKIYSILWGYDSEYECPSVNNFGLVLYTFLLLFLIFLLGLLNGFIILE